jgi:hypothetical protein
MHFRLPKPLHGWREFAGEVGVIVLGVLIAIALEQMVEAIHWRGQVRDARAAIAEDMGQTNRAFAFRAAAHDCIATRLNKLNDIIEQSAKHQPVPQVGEVMPDIGNALFQNAWQTSRASQTLTHFDRRTLRLYGSYYVSVDSVTAFLAHEVDDLTVLKILQGDPGRLGPSDISGLRVAVRRAMFDNDLIASIAQDALDTSKSLGVAVPRANPSRLAEVCRPL